VVPEHLTQSEYLVFLGPAAYHTIGIDGVVEALSSIFKIYGTLDFGLILTALRGGSCAM